MSEILIVFYSRTGKTRMVCQRLAELLEAELAEIRERKGRRGFFGVVGGAVSALRRRPVELLSCPSAEGRKLVIVATPVWAGRPAPAIRTWLASDQTSSANLAALATYDGSGAASTFQAMQQACGQEFLSTLALCKPRRDDPELHTQLSEWATKLCASV